MQMARRQPLDAPVRKPDTDAELLRLTASAANETVDATLGLGLGLHAARASAAIAHVAQRYGRALNITARDVTEALQAAEHALARAATMRRTHDATGQGGVG